MIPLTAKQRQLLDYFRACDECPSFDQMKEALGLRSKSGVHRLVNALEERGYIKRIPNRARAIELVEDPQIPMRDLAPHKLYGCSIHDLAREATRRGLVLGRSYRDVEGRLRVRLVSAG